MSASREHDWIPYLWVIPLGVFAWSISYGAAHDINSDKILSWEALGAVLGFLAFLGYPITLVACYHRAINIHQLGHLVVFTLVSGLSALIPAWQQYLQEGGPGPCHPFDEFVLFPSLGFAFWCAVFVVFAGVVLALTRWILSPPRRSGER
jgi:hypothetical protein